MNWRRLIGLKKPKRVKSPKTAQFDLNTLPALLGREDPVILEIGANDGAHSVSFLTLFPNSRLYCFEPDRRAIAAWKSRMEGKSARLFEVAVGAQNGMAQFNVSGVESSDRTREWHQSGSIHKPTGHLKAFPLVTFKEIVPVRITTLDAWAKEHGITAVDFIWADAQGAEGDLVVGGQNTLANTRFFYTEYSNRELYQSQWTLAEIKKRLPNFRLLSRYPHDALFVNRSISVESLNHP